MLNATVPRPKWAQFFDRLTRSHAQEPLPTYARIRSVRSQDWEGEQEEAWLLFRGITFEQKGDVITVALKGLDHRVEHPTSVWADQHADGDVACIEILGADERRDEIEFRARAHSSQLG